MEEIIKNRTLFIIIIASLILMIFLKGKDKEYVSAINENNIYELYLIDLEDKNITTKNIGKYITCDIVSIYPSVDKKYENIIKSKWYDIDKLISKDDNIKKIEDYYQELFRQNALSEEAIYISLNGLKISKVKIMTNNISKYKKYDIKKIYVS